MKTFTTKGGQALPLMDLKGRDYVQAQWRVVWFREEHPHWSIQTKVISEDGNTGFIVTASISDENSRIIATAHKSCKHSINKFPLETAETGAISRAMALCGYGTAFTNELDETEETLADSPIGQETDQPHCELCSSYLVYSEAKQTWFCPNYKERSKGEHTYFKEGKV